MDAQNTETLKGLVDCCKQNPYLLHTPPLAFFKKFLESLGAQIPTSGTINGTGVTIEELKGIVDYCKQLPAMLQHPRLAFFKKFLQSLGAEISRPAEISDAEAASAFKDGKVIMIHSLSKLTGKLDAASRASRLSIVCFASAVEMFSHHVIPLFKILAAKHPKIVFMIVDFDEASDIVAAWEVSEDMVPSFCFVKNGLRVDCLKTIYMDHLESMIAEHS